LGIGEFTKRGVGRLGREEGEKREVGGVTKRSMGKCAERLRRGALRGCGEGCG